MSLTGQILANIDSGKLENSDGCGGVGTSETPVNRTRRTGPRERIYFLRTYQLTWAEDFYADV